MSTDLPAISAARWKSHFTGPMESEPMEAKTAAAIQDILGALRADRITDGTAAAQLVVLGVDAESAALMVDLARHPPSLDD